MQGVRHGGTIFLFSYTDIILPTLRTVSNMQGVGHGGRFFFLGIGRFSCIDVVLPIVCSAHTISL